MSQLDPQLAAELRAMDLPQLRQRYEELYGEQSRGGADYLRTKIAYALQQQLEREGRSEGEEASSDTAAEAEAAEQRGELDEAASLYIRAASFTTGERARELRARAKACNDRLDAKADSNLEEWAAEGLTRTLELAEQAERAGDLRAAARRWGAASMLERNQSTAGAYLERGRVLEATRRAMPSQVSRDGHRLTAGELEDMGGDLPTVIDAMLRRLQEPAPALVVPDVTYRNEAPTSAFVPTNEGEKPEEAAAKPAKERDPRLPPDSTSWHPTNAPAGLLVQFTDRHAVGGLVVLESPERPEFIGEYFSTVSSLARAYLGRNVNGYQWFGLKKPWAEANIPKGVEPTLGELVGDVAAAIAPAPARNHQGLKVKPDGSLVDEPGSGMAPLADPQADEPIGTLEDASHADLVRMVRSLKDELAEAEATTWRYRTPPSVLDEARARAQAEWPDGSLETQRVILHAQAVAAERVAQVQLELSEAIAVMLRGQ